MAPDTLDTSPQPGRLFLIEEAIAASESSLLARVAQRHRLWLVLLPLGAALGAAALMGQLGQLWLVAALPVGALTYAVASFAVDYLRAPLVGRVSRGIAASAGSRLPVETAVCWVRGTPSGSGRWRAAGCLLHVGVAASGIFFYGDGTAWVVPSAAVLELSRSGRRLRLTYETQGGPRSVTVRVLVGLIGWTAFGTAVECERILRQMHC